MARRNLQPQQFFHGSSADLNEGDVVRPASEVGRKNYPGLQSWRHKEVWATNSEADAWDWGHMGGRHQEVRPTVYQVEPIDPPTKRRHLGGGPTRGAEFTMGAARVIGRIDIPPPDDSLDDPLMMPRRREEREGQGTLRLEGPVSFRPGSRPYMEQMERSFWDMKRRNAPSSNPARNWTEPRLF